MRKLYRNKNGISPVISTILMILVVMVGMSMVFAYVTVYASSYQAGVGSSILESMTIEDVWIQNSNTVQISVYNTEERRQIWEQIQALILPLLPFMLTVWRSPLRKVEIALNLTRL